MFTIDPNYVVENAAKAITEATAKATAQYFNVLEQAQAVVLDGFEQVADAAGNVEVPSVPGFDTVLPKFEAYNLPELVEGYFDFATKLVDNQREFASKVLASSTPAKS